MPPKPGSSAASGIRGAYEALGVEGFYVAHGREYVNPHDDQIVRAIALLMSAQHYGGQPGRLQVLDLSCGSGEVTVALEAWAAGGAQQPRPQQQARSRYQQHAAGAIATAPQLDITACDPYTQEAYERRTGRSAHSWSFQDVADGCLAGRSFDVCVCSFALHLCDPSCLFITLYQLACHCRWLAILAPHKQPAVKEEHGWSAVRAWKVDRVHVRLYASLNFGQPLE